MIGRTRRARTLGAVMAMGALAACGGGTDVVTRSMTIPVANGPIAAACMEAGRSGASRTRCGCIQAAADRMLPPGSHRRGAAFFAEPHLAQETRQSKQPRDVAFWGAWKSFAAGAEQMCRAA